jgi:hypothetical protein
MAQPRPHYAAVLSIDEPGNRLITQQQDRVRGRVPAGINGGQDPRLVGLVVKGDQHPRREAGAVNGQYLIAVVTGVHPQWNGYGR